MTCLTLCIIVPVLVFAARDPFGALVAFHVVLIGAILCDSLWWAVMGAM